MRYDYHIRFDESQRALDTELKTRYGYSLLHFANVIADVLADDSIFSKKIAGKSYRTVKGELESLRIIRSELVGRLDKHLEKYQPTVYPGDLAPKERGLVYARILKLEPFFDKLDQFIIPLTMIAKAFEAKPNPFFSWPDRTKGGIEFSYANQIAFYWASAMFSMRSRPRPKQVASLKDLMAVLVSKERQVHWTVISDLINWFNERLSRTIYVKKLHFVRADEGEMTANPKVLKNVYEAVRRKYQWLLLSYSYYMYFPYNQNPLHLETGFSLAEVPKGNPITNIRFYKDKIRIFIRKEGQLIIKETTFEGSRSRSILRKDEGDGRENDKNRAILDIS